jgi:hypothetical protein
MKANWLSNFLKRLSSEQHRDSGDHPGSGADPEALRQMMHRIITTRTDEIGCDECFEQVDRFAEMLLDGRDAAEALPLVQDHLDRCGDCHEELEALLEALRALA